MRDVFESDAMRQHLNRSLEKIDEPTLARLERARRIALDHQYIGHQRAPALAALGSWFPHTTATRHPVVFWASALLLLAAMYTTHQVINDYLEPDESEVDVAILTDELPIEVYLD